MQKSIYVVFLVWLLVSKSLADPIDSTERRIGITVSGLPQKLLPTYAADARAHRIQLLKPTKGSAYVGSMGGQFPILNLNALGKTLQISTATTTYLTLTRYTQSGKVSNVDFFVDFIFDLKINPNWYWRAGFGHTSQHIADDAVLNGLTPINYVKDYSFLHNINYFFNQRIMLYEGFYYWDNFKVGDQIPIDWSGKIMLQTGAEAVLLKPNNSHNLFVAVDIKFRQEFDFKTTQNMVLGYRYRSSNLRTFRLAYAFLSGYEERGQYYNQQQNLHTLGAYFEL